MNGWTKFGLIWSICFAVFGGVCLAFGSTSGLNYFATGFHIAAVGGWLLVGLEESERRA